MINLTENIRQTLEGYIGCGIFLDLQKEFDSVDCEIVLAKLNHYGVCGVPNEWFWSYHSNRQQQMVMIQVSLKINCGVPQGSVLGPLLFLLYIDDLNQAIKLFKVHHFAEDTNLLLNLSKKLIKIVNTDYMQIKCH